MGVDIYSESGILFTLDFAVDKFFKVPANKFNKLKEEISSLLEDDEKEGFNVLNISELKVWFEEFANSKIEDDYISDEEKLTEIFDTVLEHTKYSELPDFNFKYFTSNRYSGYDVPAETICVVFEDFGLFEVKLTKKGQELAKLIGSKNTKQTTWTVYSY